MSAVTNFGRPIATTRISAPRVTSPRSRVRLCVTVTVAFSSSSSFETGSPTILLRPTTTARLPAISTPAAFSILTIPFGVQGSVQGCFCHNAATLSGWKPSTSFALSMAAITFSSSICFGSGNCTRIPSTSGSAFSPAMIPIVVLRIPTSAEALALPVT